MSMNTGGREQMPEPRPQVYEDVGPKLRAHREQAGIGLRELARRVGISASMISQIETSKAQPSVGTLYAVVSTLGLSMDELFSSNGSASESGRSRDPDVGEPLSAKERSQAVSQRSWESGGAGSPVQRADTRKALRLAGGKISGPFGAAAKLGLRRTTLQSRMKKFGIERLYQ